MKPVEVTLLVCWIVQREYLNHQFGIPSNLPYIAVNA